MKIVESEIILKGCVKAYADDDGSVKVPLYISLDNGLTNCGQIEVSSFELVEPNKRDLSRDEKIDRLLFDFDREFAEYISPSHETVRGIKNELKELGVEIVYVDDITTLWVWTDDKGVVHKKLKKN